MNSAFARRPPIIERTSDMEQEPLNQIYRFEQNSSARAARLRKEARSTPHGVRRDELLRRAQQIEGLPAVREPIPSPGLGSSK